MTNRPSRSTRSTAIKDEGRAPDETLEGVRELLFGRQVRLFEEQLSQQSSDASARLEATQATMQQRVENLEAQCEQQFNKLTNRISQLEQQLLMQNQAMQESKAGRSDLAQLFSELAGRLDSPSPMADSVAVN